MRIVEVIGKRGIVSSDYQQRIYQPRPGDLIEQPDGRLGRIDSVGTGWCEPDEIMYCCELGSCFLQENGAVSISGGPFKTVKRDKIQPTLKLGHSPMWNWGDRVPGAQQGCEFILLRPVFKLEGK